jgi:hypothetical protein
MRGIVVSDLKREEKKQTYKQLNTYLSTYLLSPLKAGLIGFSAFFTILLFAKFVGAMLGSIEVFEIEVADVFFSMLGFVLSVLIKILENQNRKGKPAA